MPSDNVVSHSIKAMDEFANALPAAVEWRIEMVLASGSMLTGNSNGFDKAKRKAR